MLGQRSSINLNLCSRESEGKSTTLGGDHALARVNVISDTASLILFDGRDRAENGWFVLRSLIPSGKTTGAIVWHIRPDVIPNWTRPPMIAHSQVGYTPGFTKVAVLELDPKYNAPKTARVPQPGWAGESPDICGRATQANNHKLAKPPIGAHVHGALPLFHLSQ